VVVLYIRVCILKLRNKNGRRCEECVCRGEKKPPPKKIPTSPSEKKIFPLVHHH
jgi:hypothetical protein